MTRKGNIVHSTVSRNKNPAKDMSPNMVAALEKVKELNEEEMELEEVQEKSASKEIRDLVLFGKIIENFEIGGFTFKMSTLSNKQQKELIKRLVKLDNEERLTHIKTYTLVESIISVNGSPLTEMYEVNGATEWEKKHEIISEFQSNLVEVLFKHYESMVEKSNKFFENKGLESEIKN